MTLRDIPDEVPAELSTGAKYMSIYELGWQTRLNELRLTRSIGVPYDAHMAGLQAVVEAVRKDYDR